MPWSQYNWPDSTVGNQLYLSRADFLWESMSLVCCVVQKLPDLLGWRAGLVEQVLWWDHCQLSFIGLGWGKPRNKWSDFEYLKLFFLFSVPNSFYHLSGGRNLHLPVYWFVHRIFAEYWQCFWNWLSTRCRQVNNMLFCLNGHVTNSYNSHENVIIHRCQHFTSLLPVFKKQKVDKYSWKGLAENGLRSASISHNTCHLVHTSPGIHVAFSGHQCSWNTGPASLSPHCLWENTQTQ